MDDAVIRTEKLTKRYGKQTAVSEVSLEVPPGKIFALMGRNGAGKSSLIRMLLGLTPITAGRATVLGLDSAKQHVAIRGRVGYVPEAHHMYRWMTIAEVVRFTASFYPTWNEKSCADLIRKFDLDPSKRIKELSRGMVAKVALTLALAHEPRLLVLDEPTDGLDAVVRKEFLESIVSVAADEGRTVFISSHLLQDIERVADRVALMEESRIGLVEDADALKARFRELKITFTDLPAGSGGAPLAFDMPGILSLRKEPREWLMVFEKFGAETREQIQSKLPGAQIVARDMTLEEIFLALVGKPAIESTGPRSPASVEAGRSETEDEGKRA
jgi:ABC-2 type transport system ATP-binding protein